MCALDDPEIDAAPDGQADLDGRWWSDVNEVDRECNFLCFFLSQRYLLRTAGE